MKHTLSLLALSSLLTLPALHAAAPAPAEQKGSPLRLLVASAGGKIAIVTPNGAIERELKVPGLHDASLLPNGNLLCQSGWTKVIEVDPSGKTVWEYDAAKAPENAGKRFEIHAVQRLPNGLTLVAESGTARLLEVDRDGKVQHQIPLTVDHPSPHRDTRLVRVTPTGTYLVAHEGDGKVREYDRSGKVVWEYAVPLFGKKPAGGHGPEAFGNQLFSALRLENGHTLIGTGNGHSVLEVNPKGEIVWKLEQNDLPGITLAWVTRVERLPNGNTRLGNCHAGQGMPLSLEVTPDKKVVWSYSDYDRFGNSTVLVDALPPSPTP